MKGNSNSRPSTARRRASLLDWATANATRMSNYVYDKLRIDAQADTPIVSALGMPITCFVYVEDVSPFRPLRLQLDSYRRYGAEFDGVLQDHWLFENLNFTGDLSEMLAARDDDPRIPALLRQQVWPCASIARSRDELFRQLRVRYLLGRSETDFGTIETGDRVIALCRVLPREWR